MNRKAIGIVVIGRNEGQRLQRALESIPSGAANVLYVDSGSTDGSSGLARSMNIAVHQLDPAESFSAARARREGAEILMKMNPGLKWIQFLDGDCVLEKGWIEYAIEHISGHPDIGIVCGLLSEMNPSRSIYNRIIAVRWNAVTGDIDSCGGIFMIRKSIYDAIGGFNAALLTGEEAELCSRVRKSGYRIVRLKAKMARHDADLVNFRQWWVRAVWGGFGDAIEYKVLQGKVSDCRRRETRSILIWTIIVPLMGLIGLLSAIESPWFILVPVMCVLAYFSLIVRIARDRWQRGDAVSDAALYAVFCVLRKLPYAIGFYKYKLYPASCARRPDPHAPGSHTHSVEK